MVSFVVSILIINGIFMINKKIDNKGLNKQIDILGIILLIWIVIRTVKYNFISDAVAKRYLWYSYYFSVLYSSTVFLNIGTWHNRNKAIVKALKLCSVIISSLLFALIMTNDLHKLAFVFDLNDPDFESVYTYGILYYLCFIWVFINIVISIFSTIKYSKAQYKKEKSVMLTLILFIVFMYAVGFVVKSSIISAYFRDFTLVYCTCYLLALIIVVYKEKYRLTIEDNLYNEIEDAIKDKTIIINRIINNIHKSKDKKKDLNYIKLLISYCKRKSNLIVIQKDRDSYSSNELKLFIENAFTDAVGLGITGAVNIINSFEIPVYVASVIYSYIYSLFEYSNNYENTNILISIQKSNHIIITACINTDEQIKSVDFNFETNKYLADKNITIKKEDSNTLNIKLELTSDSIAVTDNNLSDKEKQAVLQIKSKIHDILGQRLSVLSRIIDEETIDTNKVNDIKPLLNNILDDLNNDKHIDPNEMLIRLVYTCELVGTNLYISGKLPDNYLKANAIVKTIRECSTNAIKHAEAKNIYVTIQNLKSSTKLTVSNDGKVPASFTAGDGIKGIKLRVEELGGQINIGMSDLFTVTVTI